MADHEVEIMLRNEAAAMLTAVESRENPSRYRFFLSEFPRKDILGMSVGSGRIYISYKLTSLAMADPDYLWLLRQTLAHEIAHESAGHANQKNPVWFNQVSAAGPSARDIGLPWYVRLVNYSTEKELDADRIGLGYWSKLGWNCRIWVRILEDLDKRNYRGDDFHPTDRRLQEAKSVCAADGRARTVAAPIDSVSLPSSPD